MVEKQLKGNLVEVSRSILTKFDAKNVKDTTTEHDHPHEILMIRIMRGRQEEHDGVDNLTRSM